MPAETRDGSELKGTSGLEPEGPSDLQADAFPTELSRPLANCCEVNT